MVTKQSIKEWCEIFGEAFAQKYSDTWLLEIIAMTLSFASLAATAGLLAHFHGKPISQWEWHVLTLNTMVSILTTLAKTLLLYVLASCLGQWKYIAFSKQPRDLIEFDILDNASRGPGGSLMLLAYTRLRSLAAIGAILTILSLGLDPFAQQVIGFGVGGASEFDASIPQSTEYRSAGSSYPSNLTITKGTSSSSLIISPDLSMQAAILSGLSENITAIQQRLPYRCNGTECRWGAYKSLAVCSECTSITHLIQTKSRRDKPGPDGRFHPQIDNFSKLFNSSHTQNLTVMHSLPNGLFLDQPSRGTVTNISMLTRSTTKASLSMAFTGDERTRLLSMSILKARILSNALDPPIANECNLFLCVQSFSSSVRDGQLFENSTKLDTTTSNDVRTNQSDADLLLDGTFAVSNNSVTSLRRGLEEILTDRNLRTQEVGASGFLLESSTHNIQEYGPYSALSIARDNVKAFRGVAVSMTNSFRIQSSSKVEGIGLGTVYSIRWWWLSLPAFVTFVTYVFLALCIYLTACRDIPIWKSSSLPVLKCGAENHELLDGKQRISEMEREAVRTKLAFIQTKYARSTKSMSDDFTPGGSPDIGANQVDVSDASSKDRLLEVKRDQDVIERVGRLSEEQIHNK